MLDNILNELASSEAPEFSDVKHVCLHVHTANKDGMNFYKKHGFEVKDTVEDYYKDIQPRSAHILQRDMSELRAAAEREKSAAAKAAAGTGEDVS